MALLLAMLIVIGINFVYINEVSEKLLTRIDALPDIEDPACFAATQELQSEY